MLLLPLQAWTKFLDHVLTAVVRHVNWDIVKCLVIAGPGFAKDSFKEYMEAEAVRQNIRCVVGPLARRARGRHVYDKVCGNRRMTHAIPMQWESSLWLALCVRLQRFMRICTLLCVVDGVWIFCQGM